MVRVKPVQEPAEETAPTLPLHPRFGCPAAYRFVLVTTEQRVEQLVDGDCYSTAVGFHLETPP